MPLTLGDHDNSVSGTAVEPGVYSGIIESVSIVMENGIPKLTENGKESVDVAIRVDREITLRRRMSISFGQNSANGQWAVLAKFIEVATGIKCGDKAQRTVTDDALIGQLVRCVVETSDRGYSNITSFLPAQKDAQKPRTASGLSKKNEDANPFDDELEF
jgi:hypothetical protein